MLHRGLAKGVDPVADRFDPGHRRAAAGEGAQQQPPGDAFRGGRERRWSRNRARSPAGPDCLGNSENQQPAKTGDKKVGRYRKDDAGFERAAQVDKCDQRQHGEAQFEGVGMELRRGRGQSRDPGRDADRDIQHIVYHQRGGGEQAGITAEVFLGYRVGAAIARIGLDGLPV